MGRLYPIQTSFPDRIALLKVRSLLLALLEGLILVSLLILALALRLRYQNGLTATDDFFYAHLAATGVKGDLHFEKYISEAKDGHIWPYPFRFPVWIPTSLSFQFLGISQQTATFWPLLASLLSIVALFVTARLLVGVTAALISAFVLATLPSDILHSGLLVPEAPANLFLMLSAGCFLAAWNAFSSSIRFSSSFLYFLSGFSLALGIWTREYLLFLLPVFFLLIFFDLLTRAFRKEQTLWDPNLFWWIPGFLSAYLPFEIFLHQHTGEWNYRWHLIRLMASDWREAFPLTDIKTQLFFYSKMFLTSETWLTTTFLFFLSAPLLVAYGFKSGRSRSALGAAAFTLIFFFVNEFGTSDLHRFEPLHKLERFANLFGPPLALCIGVGLGSFPDLVFGRSRLLRALLTISILIPLGLLLLPLSARALPKDSDYQSYAWYRVRLAAFEKALPANIDRLYVPTVLWDDKRKMYWPGNDEWKQRFRFWDRYQANESNFIPLYPRQNLEILSNGLLFADAAWLEQRKSKNLKLPPDRWKVLTQNGVGAFYEITAQTNP